MSTIVFDTHAVASRYRAAGFSEPQVEALVETAREASDLPDISSLATKADLERLALVTKTDIDLLGGRMDQLAARFDGRIDQLAARVDGKIDQLGTRLDGKIDQLGTRLDGRMDQLDGKLGLVQAELKAAIASTQLQTIYFILTAMVALTVLSTWLSRLIR
jgi:hypothetical protein